MDGCHLNGHDRIDAGGNGLTHDRVYVPPGNQIMGLPVIRTPHEPVRGPGGDQRQQRLKISGLRTFTDKNVHAGSQFFPGFFKMSAFMVAGNTCRQIGVQLFA